jgi:integrase
LVTFVYLVRWVSWPVHFADFTKLAGAVSLWRKPIAQVFKDAKIQNGHTHRFRGTFSVSLLELGVSLEDVSTLPGHQNIKITQKDYAPWIKTRQDTLDRAVETAWQAYEKGRN